MLQTCPAAQGAHRAERCTSHRPLLTVGCIPSIHTVRKHTAEMKGERVQKKGLAGLFSMFLKDEPSESVAIFLLWGSAVLEGMEMLLDSISFKQIPTKSISQPYPMDSNTNRNVLARNNGVKNATEDRCYQIKQKDILRTFK